MPELTPRQRLTQRVADRLCERGFSNQSAHATATLAVHAWYGEERDAEFHHLVSQEAMAAIVDVVPEFARHMRSAFEGVLANARNLAAAATPWVQLAEQLEARGPRRPQAFDASGLPAEAGDLEPHIPAAVDRQAEPCIEEGCGADAVPGTAFCADCMPTPSTGDRLILELRDHITGDTSLHEVPEDIATEVALADTGRSATFLRPYRRPEGMDPNAPAPMFEFGGVGSVEASRDGGQTWEPVPGILSVEIRGSNEPTDLVELTPREWHLSAVRGLRKLGCTYAQLAEMARTGDFATGNHHSLWFNISGTIDREQLDRAEFVLTGLEDETGVPADVTLSDHLIEELERDYPTDRITGAPHHYVVNGDHSECGCGGHSLKCEVWNVPTALHKPTICDITQTNCRHSPRHTYGQLCDFNRGEQHASFG